MATGGSSIYARWRLVVWLVFVLALAALNYYGHYRGADPPDDLAYRYSTAVLALAQYGIFLAIVLAIAYGTPTRRTFALRRPASWIRALGLVGAALVGVYVCSSVYVGVLSLFTESNPTEEQNLVPDGWDSSRAGAFVAFFVAVTVLGPVVEELMFRGLGFSLFERYGRWTAILATSVIFGLYHGLVVALPVLVVVGLALAWLRARTSSIYPPMVMHGVFNGVALIVSVAAG
jgi:membrane protease YdiL (CAAX protease family)